MRSLVVGLMLASQWMRCAEVKTSWPLWESYTNHFLESGRIVDHDANDRTTSEAQAYALFFSLVANDRARFDSILGWTQENLADGDLATHLPAWQWEKGRSSWRESDKNSAADADLWLAYTLCEAGRLWHDQKLDRSGRALAQTIADRETTTIPGLGAMMLPGPFGFTNSDGWFELNASYLPVQILLGLDASVHDPIWREIASHVPALLRGSLQSGFILDWIAYRPGDGFSLYPSPADAPLASYDAIRVYLWAGMLDRGSRYRDDTLGAMAGMADYMTNHAAPPAVVTPEGHIKDAFGGVGFSSALLPFLKAYNLNTPFDRQMKRLQAQRDPASGLFGKPPRYYDQNLALFATGWCEGRFQFESSGLLKVSWN